MQKESDPTVGLIWNVLYIADRTSQPFSENGKPTVTRLTNGFSKKWEKHHAALGCILLFTIAECTKAYAEHRQWRQE
ncbi:MAG TPA: hypothetical protein VGW76_21545 [Pyrinomonadaceae bacterium]|nr:hypothetical protein [Pyrinomonadaceae bacterium]